MKDEIENLHRYFRIIGTIEKENVDCVNQDELDQFFFAISTFYSNCLARGLAKIDCESIGINNVIVKDYFITGYTCIQNGMEPLAIEIIMGYMASALINSKDITHQELFEIKFLEKLLPLMQGSKTNEFIYVIEKFCSAQILCQIKDKLAAGLN
jgi:hypothetical protein